MSSLWMVSYDISDNKARRQVHNLLLDHGQRVQYSVFECRLKPRQRDQLRAEVQTHLQVGDSVRWYPLCKWCEAEVHWQGTGVPLANDNFYLL